MKIFINSLHHNNKALFKYLSTLAGRILKIILSKASDVQISKLRRTRTSLIAVPAFSHK